MRSQERHCTIKRWKIWNPKPPLLRCDTCRCTVVPELCTRKFFHRIDWMASSVFDPDSCRGRARKWQSAARLAVPIQVLELREFGQLYRIRKRHHFCELQHSHNSGEQDPGHGNGFTSDATASGDQDVMCRWLETCIVTADVLNLWCQS